MDCATFVPLFISFSFLSEWCRPRRHCHFTFAHLEDSLSLVLAPGAGLSPVCVPIWPGSLQLQFVLSWRDEMSQPHNQQQLSFLLQYLVVLTEPTGPSLAGRRGTPCPLPPAIYIAATTTATGIAASVPTTTTRIWCRLVCRKGRLEYLHHSIGLCRHCVR